MASVKAICVLALAITTMASVNAELGACRYDTDRCSCKMGAENQGICWDPVAGTPGTCSKRFCKSGWTCACGDRSHVCYIKPKTAMKVADGDKALDTAPCSSQQISVTANREISLGTLRLHISPKGAAANECLELAWWHNGELMGNYKPVDGMDASQTTEQLAIREQHSSLELRGGDILSWRFRDASYYCQKKRVDLVVNGTVVDLNTLGTEIRYSKGFTTDWFSPAFEPVLGAGENETNVQMFLPLRSVLSDGTAVTSDGDFYQDLDPTSPDHLPGNFYFRLVLPHNLTTTHANAPAVVAV